MLSTSTKANNLFGNMIANFLDPPILERLSNTGTHQDQLINEASQYLVQILFFHFPGMNKVTIEEVVNKVAANYGNKPQNPPTQPDSGDCYNSPEKARNREVSGLTIIWSIVVIKESGSKLPPDLKNELESRME
jgi:hypothetical protein